MFLFKKKTITVDAFTPLDQVQEFFEIKRAIEYAPEWWKKLPNSYTENTPQGIDIKLSTMKRCAGFIDLYTKGFIMPMWVDTVIKTFADGTYTYVTANGSQFISTHDPRQSGELANSTMHLKIGTPWLFKEKTGVNFLFTEPMWNNIATRPSVRTVPGVVNYKYQHSTHVNLLLPKQNQQIEFNAGEPLTHIIPITEDNVQVVCHLVSEEEYLKINSNRLGIFFQKKYDKLKAIQDKKSCPFK